MFDSPDKLLLGLATGIMFGVLLQKGRVAKFPVIVSQFLLKDWTVAKIMGTAVVVGAIGVYALVAAGHASLHVRPLLFGGVLYMVNDNGIVTTLDPETGALIKQGRLSGAPGPHFASPIAADGHIFFTSEAGVVVVVAPGGDLTPRFVNALHEDTYATPAFADGRLYVRTVEALYAFGSR